MSDEETVGFPEPDTSADGAQTEETQTREDDKDSSPAAPQTVAPGQEGVPVQTDNTERPEDGEQDVDQDDPNFEEE